MLFEKELTYKIRGCMFAVYNELGPGLLEDIYEEALEIELNTCGIKCQRQVFLPVVYKGRVLKSPLRMDMLVEDKVIVELKSVECLHPVYFKQLQTYLKLSGCKVGFLVNFNTSDLREDIHRIVN